jgi:hypothetical protein
MTAEALNPDPRFGTTWQSVGTDGFLRFWASKLTRVANGANANVSGQAYWVYMDFIDQVTLLQGITLMQATIQGAGTQVAEVCFASTPVGPNRAGQTLTKIGNADSALTSLTAAATSVVRPGAPMNASIPAFTHLWCGFRQAMGTTQAGFECLSDDMLQGAVLITPASGALSGPGPFAGALTTLSVAAVAPMMFATVD